MTQSSPLEFIVSQIILHSLIGLKGSRSDYNIVNSTNPRSSRMRYDFMDRSTHSFFENSNNIFSCNQSQKYPRHQMNMQKHIVTQVLAFAKKKSNVCSLYCSVYQLGAHLEVLDWGFWLIAGAGHSTISFLNRFLKRL